MAGLETLPNLPFGLVIANGLSSGDVARLSGCSRTLYARRLELLRLLPLAARHAALADAVIHHAPEEVTTFFSARATRAMVASNFCHLLRMCCEHHGLAVLRSLHEQGLIEKADLLWTRQLPSMDEEERGREYEMMRSVSASREYDQDSERGCFPLLAAAAAGDVDVLRFLTTAFGLSNADYEGHSLRQAPLRAACCTEHPEVARYILAELGFSRHNIACTYDPGWRATPAPAILCAARAASRELVELLVEHQQLTAADFRIDFEDGNGGNNIGMLLREAGDADVEFLLWLLRRMEMTAEDLLGESSWDGDRVLSRFVNQDDTAGDLPRWLEAVRADTADVHLLLRELVEHKAIFKGLLSLGLVTVADVTAGGEDSLAVLAALRCGGAVEALMAPPFSLPRSAFRAGNCAALRMALKQRAGAATFSRLLGTSRDILEDEVRDAEVDLARVATHPNLEYWEASVAEARKELEAWDAGERQDPPPLFSAADKPHVLAELKWCLQHGSAFLEFEITRFRLLARRFGATRDDLGDDGAPELLMELATARHDSTEAEARDIIREGLLRVEDAQQHAAALLHATLGGHYGCHKSSVLTLFGPLGLTAEHALLPLHEGELPGGFLRGLAGSGGGIAFKALEYVLTSVGLSKEDIAASGCLEAARAGTAFLRDKRIALIQQVLGGG